MPQNLSAADRWSSGCSWPGGVLPQAGDNVTIPAGRILLLDVSPPPLNRLTIEGTLVFDHTQPVINLQARTIFVNASGNLTAAGPNGTAYPTNSRVNITLLGLPPAVTGAVEQPLFDKALVLRQGSVALTGAVQSPSYALLNATADVNATSIWVNGNLTWVVGDCIVLASSSFFAEEVDEVVITGVAPSSGNSSSSSRTLITFSPPLRFTHLGEVVSVAGETRALDMRAEVAVLSRNVLITVRVLRCDQDLGRHAHTAQPTAHAASLLAPRYPRLVQSPKHIHGHQYHHACRPSASHARRPLQP
jgi:hypothetical protein